MVPGAGIEPARLSARDFESRASTNSTTRATLSAATNYGTNMKEFYFEVKISSTWLFIWFDVVPSIAPKFLLLFHAIKMDVFTTNFFGVSDWGRIAKTRCQHFVAGQCPHIVFEADAPVPVAQNAQRLVFIQSG